MESAILAKLFENGPGFIVLGLALWYFYRREVRSEIKVEERAKLSEERCDQDRKILTEKVDRLEDSLAVLHQNALKSATDALAQNVRAFERFCDHIDQQTPSGGHRTRSE